MISSKGLAALGHECSFAPEAVDLLSTKVLSPANSKLAAILNRVC
jgi:hypothetical protein